MLTRQETPRQNKNLTKHLFDNQQAKVVFIFRTWKSEAFRQVSSSNYTYPHAKTHTALKLTLKKNIASASNKIIKESERWWEKWLSESSQEAAMKKKIVLFVLLVNRVDMIEREQLESTVLLTDLVFRNQELVCNTCLWADGRCSSLAHHIALDG